MRVMGTILRSLLVSHHWSGAVVVIVVAVAVISLGLRPSAALAAKTDSPLSGTVSGVVTLDGTERILTGLFLRRYINWCARTRHFGRAHAAMDLYRSIA